MFKLAAALAALLLCVAPARAETIRIGNAADPETLDPQRYTLVIETRILGDAFEGLVALDAKGEPIPGMAETWEISADGLTYTFHLRGGLVWSDGTPLTVDDIIAGYRRAFDPATAAQLADLAYSIKNAKPIAEGKLAPDQLGIAAPDVFTIVITLEAPRLTFLQLSAQFPLFFPVPRHVLAEAGDDWVKPGTMVSNGPYSLAEWVPGDHIRLVRNPRYWDAAHVALDEVLYYPVEDANAGLKRFRAGEIDWMTDFPIGQYEWLKANMPDRTFVYPISNVFFLSINQRKPQFADLRVRRALSLAIDRDTIVRKIFYDMGTAAAYSIIPPSVPGWTTPEGADFGATPLTARQDEARRLLAEAGYGPDNPLAFELDFATAESNRRLAPALASMWQAVGVNATPQFSETKVLFQMLREHDFDLAASSWNAFADPEFYVDLTRTDSDRNYSGWSNADYDRLIAEAIIELDPARRLDLYRQADAIEASNVALIPLTYGVSRNLVQTYVKGFVSNPTNTHPTRFLRVER